MAQPETIELRKSRNFGDQINVTFYFIRENFKKLGKAILIIAGPSAVLAGVVMGYAYAGLYSGDPDPDRILELLPALGVGTLIAALSGIFMIAVVVDYVRLYHDRGGAEFDIHDIWREVKRDLGRVFVAMLGLIGLGLLLSLPIILFAAMDSAALTAIYLFIFFIGFIYFSIPLSILFPVYLCEGEGLWASIGRSMELVKGHWWLTAGILFVIYLIAQFTSSIFFFPAQMIGAFASISTIDSDSSGGVNVIVLIFAILGSVVASLAAALPTLASVLHYFNLVEKLEGVGLMGRIEEIGGGDDGNLNANTL